MYDTAAFDSFGSTLKIISLIGFASCLLIPNDKKVFADSKAVIYNSVLLFSLFISITSNNLLLTYIAFELLSFSYFSILKTGTRTKIGSIKLSSFYSSWIISSSLMLFGISLFYGLFGSLNYNLINEYLYLNQVNKLTLAISVILIFSGFALKLFLFPLQSVISDVFSILSIEKISIILVTSIIAGSAAFIRFFYSVFNGTNANHFNWELFIVIFFSINILTSAFMLYLQKDFLPAIIYMILINVPFLFLSSLCIDENGLINYLLIIVYFVISSVGIFTFVYVVKSKFPVTGIRELKGIFKSSQFGASISFILLLSISGFPLTCGFIVRLYLFSNIKSDFYPLILIASVISSFICLIILYRLIIASASEYDNNPPPIVLNFSQKLILIISVLLTFMLGIYPEILTGYSRHILII